MLQLANKWYDHKMISSDITLLYEQNIHPFLRCNIWRSQVSLFAYSFPK